MALGLHHLLKSPGRLRQFLIGCMAIGFLALGLAIFGVFYATQRTQAHTAAVIHTLQVESGIGNVAGLAEQAETSRRGYLLTSDPVTRDTSQAATRDLDRALLRLARLVRDNDRQLRTLALAHAELDRLARHRDESLSLVAAGRRDEAIARFRATLPQYRLAPVRRTLDRMLMEERRLLAVRQAERERSTIYFYVMSGVAATLILLLAVASLLTVLRYVRDLDRTQRRLAVLNEGLEEEVATRTADLTRANEEIQRFAYIVSHDLRSPLVNVMGFTAELEAATGQVSALIDRVEAADPALVEDNDRLAVREDLPEAIGFIRSSTQKMDRLINAILALSRQGRRVLAPEALDLATMLIGIRDTFEHRLEEEGGTVDIVTPMPTLVADRVAIEQILSNLIENALKYRDPARAPHVTVTAERAGPSVRIAVADNGRGIAPHDHERVFDLFRRSGRQDQPGEGIGLAHVRAVALRLGGTIGLTSTIGEGSTFTLSLPATPTQERPA